MSFVLNKKCYVWTGGNRGNNTKIQKFLFKYGYTWGGIKQNINHTRESCYLIKPGNKRIYFSKRSKKSAKNVEGINFYMFGEFDSIFINDNLTKIEENYNI